MALIDAFKKSSYCSNMHCLEARWHKSSHSNPSGSCVAARDIGVVQVRDTKDKRPDAPVLEFTREQWMTFLSELR